MAAKTITVELSQGMSFATECRIGEHTVMVDQPRETGGADTGPTPLDYQLVALGGCITAVGRIIANQRRLKVRGIRVVVVGQLDTDGILGKTSSERTGFSSIRAAVTIDADMSVQEKSALVAEIERRCPISDNLVNATSVRISLAG